MATSAMVRTLAELKKYKIPYWIVESYNHFTKQRVDMFHIFDVLALDNGFVGVQICGTDIKPHKDKIMVEYATNSLKWLRNGGRIEIWAWRKLLKIKKDGKKSKVPGWKVRIFDVLLVHNELFWEERTDCT